MVWIEIIGLERSYSTSLHILFPRLARCMPDLRAGKGSHHTCVWHRFLQPVYCLLFAACHHTCENQAPLCSLERSLCRKKNMEQSVHLPLRYHLQIFQSVQAWGRCTASPPGLGDAPNHSKTVWYSRGCQIMPNQYIHSLETATSCNWRCLDIAE